MAGQGVLSNRTWHHLVSGRLVGSRTARPVVLSRGHICHETQHPAGRNAVIPTPIWATDALGTPLTDTGERLRPPTKLVCYLDNRPASLLERRPA